MSGYFIFSLDTELSTGYFDHDEARHRLFSTDGKPERSRIAKILQLCEQYQIHATWAVVGHLFFSRCEYCDPCPLAGWRGKYQSFDEAYGTENPLWYGADVVNRIQRCSIPQEIGFHGFSHRVLTDTEISEKDAQVEISEWKRLAERYGIQGRSVVFPRDKIGHLSQLQTAGFDNYRYETPLPSWQRNRYFGKYLKTLDYIASISHTPIHPPTMHLDEGMLRIPDSQHLFAFNLQVDSLLDSLGMPTLRIQRILRGIRRAAKQGKIFHVWAHPWEFRTQGDWIKLEAIFKAVRMMEQVYGLQSITMGAMADVIKQNAEEHPGG